MDKSQNNSKDWAISRKPTFSCSSSKLVGSSEATREALINYSSTVQPVHPQWVVGLVDGEGNFSVDLASDKTMRLGYRVQLNFNVTQHMFNRIVLDLCNHFFGVGQIRVNNKRHAMLIFRVRDLNDLLTVIIPFFETNRLRGTKDLDFQDFRTVAFMMRDGLHLTEDGLATIRKIKAGMNRGRR